MSAKNDDTGKVYHVELKSDFPDEITVDLYIPGEEDDFIIETELTPEEIAAANEVPPPFNTFKNITYFKVRDKNRNVITNFNPPMELHLRYTYDAWYESNEKDYWKEKGRPRVFYLEKKGNTWVGPWQEFPDPAITAMPPTNNNTFGFLNISIDVLPDPKIGGC